jgi:uncharacterized integral membrane protein
MAAGQEGEPRAVDSATTNLSTGPPPEPRGERLRRHGRRYALYLRAGLIVVLLAVLIALIAANTQSTSLNWVAGTSHASLVWIVFAAAVIGWLLGLATGAMFRRRTRRRVTTGRDAQPGKSE